MTPKKRVQPGRSGGSSAPARGHLRNGDPLATQLKNHCFGCAPGNQHGLRLKFTGDLESDSVVCEFRVARRFEGPPGHVHGGVIATILDEAMGKVNRRNDVVALTRRMAIDYLHPVPLGVRLRAVGWPVNREGRKHFIAGEIRTLEGKVLARSEGLFIAIDPAEMIRKYGNPRPTAP